ncbi:MAG: isoprenylcysteine carboxylmethyltransferase family protein [Candidatus Omnitrophica bacterium]|nr:isoprenylcysteine carboxylmethyltransferase family protein [Candidatus Omnitrophota bacterium]
MTHKTTELLKAIVILPGTALIYIPAIILYVTGSWNFLGGWSFPLALIPLAGGLFLILASLFFMIRTMTLFLTVGDGTPAPWAPPKRFVVKGPYCYVRNPMLLSALVMILGEVILSGSWPMFVWFMAFWVINTIYFIFFEEPGLVKRFGNDYINYTKHVSRWIPRLTPWEKG